MWDLSVFTLSYCKESNVAIGKILKFYFKMHLKLKFRVKFRQEAVILSVKVMNYFENLI